MSVKNRVGLTMMIIAVWALIAAPHSEFTSTITFISVLNLLAGIALLLGSW